jgi:plasmid stabilization system protein ParE
VKVVFSEQALDDLAAIRADDRFTAAQAKAMAQKIIAQCLMLDEFPLLGYAGRQPETREIIVKPFVVVYEITPSGIAVINIWHGRQSRQPPGI